MELLSQDKYANLNGKLHQQAIRDAWLTRPVVLAAAERSVIGFWGHIRGAVTQAGGAISILVG
jgi:hypothetical protein